jgi:hypothetical protein
MIQALPVVANRFWILKKDDRKIGQVEAQDDGVVVRIQDQVVRYKTIKMAGRAANIEFEKANRPVKSAVNHVHGYQVSGRVYNPLWDVKHRLPLFTRDSKSKSWYAAGWYAVKQHKNWKAVQNPKLISLQRYPYQGPFHTEGEARDKSVS